MLLLTTARTLLIRPTTTKKTIIAIVDAHRSRANTIITLRSLVMAPSKKKAATKPANETSGVAASSSKDKATKVASATATRAKRKVLTANALTESGGSSPSEATPAAAVSEANASANGTTGSSSDKSSTSAPTKKKTKRTATAADGGDESSSSPLKVVSWNVAGLRACIKKGGHNFLAASNADLIFLQETKCAELPAEIEALDAYPIKHLYKTEGDGKGGHGGVALLSKRAPLTIVTGLGGDADFDSSGRYIQCEFPDCYVVGVYVPNSGRGLPNLPRRKVWDRLTRERLSELDKRKPVIYVGDMNVAHGEIDLTNPATNRNRTAGFTDQEREDFGRLLDAGFVDVWRQRNPTRANAYTFWSYMRNARASNVGWRLDYCVVSRRLMERVVECELHPEVSGSDHCPISMTIRV